MSTRQEDLIRHYGIIHQAMYIGLEIKQSFCNTIKKWSMLQDSKGLISIEA